MFDPDRDYPALIADAIESVADKVRSLTVDRVAVGLTWTALGLVVAVIVVVGVVWLLVAYFRVFGALVGQELAYAITGGILIVVGALLWRRRISGSGED